MSYGAAARCDHVLWRSKKLENHCAWKIGWIFAQDLWKESTHGDNESMEDREGVQNPLIPSRDLVRSGRRNRWREGHTDAVAECLTSNPI